MIRRLSFAASIPAAFAVLLAACGQGRGSGAAPATTATATETATPATTATASSAVDGGAPSDDGGAPSPDSGAAPSSAPEGMTEIPAGIYIMGTQAAFGMPEEQPQHEVAVARFYIDTTEVTTAAYKKCVADGKCKTTHATRFCNEPHTDRDDHPINCTDWFMADAYCKAVGKRLPTEREWEYAARGGSEQRTFSWGEEPPSPTNACYQHGESCPIKTFKPGAFGLYDMSGNVWEWTSTWFGTYPHEQKTGTHKVYRGGSWSRRFPKWLRNAIRNRYLPEEFSASVGFRCAQDAPPLTCPKDHEAKDGQCVRTTGQPWCEPGHPWNGKECGGYDRNKAPEKSPEEIAAEPVVKTRTPQHDEDCKQHYPGKPAAYKFSGNTFHARNPSIAAGGCSRRDMGQTWTSACCPG